MARQNDDGGFFFYLFCTPPFLFISFFFPFLFFVSYECCGVGVIQCIVHGTIRRSAPLNTLYICIVCRAHFPCRILYGSLFASITIAIPSPFRDDALQGFSCVGSGPWTGPWARKRDGDPTTPTGEEGPRTWLGPRRRDGSSSGNFILTTTQQGIPVAVPSSGLSSPSAASPLDHHPCIQHPEDKEKVEESLARRIAETLQCPPPSRVPTGTRDGGGAEVLSFSMGAVGEAAAAAGVGPPPLLRRVLAYVFGADAEESCLPGSTRGVPRVALSILHVREAADHDQDATELVEIVDELSGKIIKQRANPLAPCGHPPRLGREGERSIAPAHYNRVEQSKEHTPQVWRGALAQQASDLPAALYVTVQGVAEAEALLAEHHLPKRHQPLHELSPGPLDDTQKERQPACAEVFRLYTVLVETPTAGGRTTTGIWRLWAPVYRCCSPPPLDGITELPSSIPLPMFVVLPHRTKGKDKRSIPQASPALRPLPVQQQEEHRGLKRKGAWATAATRTPPPPSPSARVKDGGGGEAIDVIPSLTAVRRFIRGAALDSSTLVTLTLRLPSPGANWVNHELTAAAALWEKAMDNPHRQSAVAMKRRMENCRAARLLLDRYAMNTSTYWQRRRGGACTGSREASETPPGAIPPPTPALPPQGEKEKEDQREVVEAGGPGTSCLPPPLPPSEMGGHGFAQAVQRLRRRMAYLSNPAAVQLRRHRHRRRASRSRSRSSSAGPEERRGRRHSNAATSTSRQGEGPHQNQSGTEGWESDAMGEIGVSLPPAPAPGLGDASLPKGVEASAGPGARYREENSVYLDEGDEEEVTGSAGVDATQLPADATLSGAATPGAAGPRPSLRSPSLPDAAAGLATSSAIEALQSSVPPQRPLQDGGRRAGGGGRPSIAHAGEEALVGWPADTAVVPPHLAHSTPSLPSSPPLSGSGASTTHNPVVVWCPNTLDTLLIAAVPPATGAQGPATGPGLVATPSPKPPSTAPLVVRSFESFYFDLVDAADEVKGEGGSRGMPPSPPPQPRPLLEGRPTAKYGSPAQPPAFAIRRPGAGAEAEEGEGTVLSPPACKLPGWPPTPTPHVLGSVRHTGEERANTVKKDRPSTRPPLAAEEAAGAARVGRQRPLLHLELVGEKGLEETIWLSSTVSSATSPSPSSARPPVLRGVAGVTSGGLPAFTTTTPTMLSARRHVVADAAEGAAHSPSPRCQRVGANTAAGGGPGGIKVTPSSRRTTTLGSFSATPLSRTPHPSSLPSPAPPPTGGGNQEQESRGAAPRSRQPQNAGIQEDDAPPRTPPPPAAEAGPPPPRTQAAPVAGVVVRWAGESQPLNPDEAEPFLDLLQRMCLTDPVEGEAGKQPRHTDPETFGQSPLEEERRRRADATTARAQLEQGEEVGTIQRAVWAARQRGRDVQQRSPPPGGRPPRRGNGRGVSSGAGGRPVWARPLPAAMMTPKEEDEEEVSHPAPDAEFPPPSIKPYAYRRRRPLPNNFATPHGVRGSGGTAEPPHEEEAHTTPPPRSTRPGTVSAYERHFNTVTRAKVERLLQLSDTALQNNETKDSLTAKGHLVLRVPDRSKEQQNNNNNAHGSQLHDEGWSIGSLSPISQTGKTEVEEGGNKTKNYKERKDGVVNDTLVFLDQTEGLPLLQRNNNPHDIAVEGSFRLVLQHSLYIYIYIYTSIYLSVSLYSLTPSVKDLFPPLPPPQEFCFQMASYCEVCNGSYFVDASGGLMPVAAGGGGPLATPRGVPIQQGSSSRGDICSRCGGQITFSVGARQRRLRPESSANAAAAAVALPGHHADTFLSTLRRESGVVRRASAGACSAAPPSGSRSRSRSASYHPQRAATPQSAAVTAGRGRMCASGCASSTRSSLGRDGPPPHTHSHSPLTTSGTSGLTAATTSSSSTGAGRQGRLPQRPPLSPRKTHSSPCAGAHGAATSSPSRGSVSRSREGEEEEADRLLFGDSPGNGAGGPSRAALRHMLGRLQEAIRGRDLGAAQDDSEGEQPGKERQQPRRASSSSSSSAQRGPQHRGRSRTEKVSQQDSRAAKRHQQKGRTGHPACSSRSPSSSFTATPLRPTYPYVDGEGRRHRRHGSQRQHQRRSRSLSSSSRRSSAAHKNSSRTGGSDKRKGRSAGHPHHHSSSRSRHQAERDEQNPRSRRSDTTPDQPTPPGPQGQTHPSPCLHPGVDTAPGSNTSSPPPPPTTAAAAAPGCAITAAEQPQPQPPPPLPNPVYCGALPYGDPTTPRGYAPVPPGAGPLPGAERVGRDLSGRPAGFETHLALRQMELRQEYFEREQQKHLNALRNGFVELCKVVKEELHTFERQQLELQQRQRRRSRSASTTSSSCSDGGKDGSPSSTCCGRGGGRRRGGWEVPPQRSLKDYATNTTNTTTTATASSAPSGPGARRGPPLAADCTPNTTTTTTTDDSSTPGAPQDNSVVRSLRRHCRRHRAVGPDQHGGRTDRRGGAVGEESELGAALTLRVRECREQLQRLPPAQPQEQPRAALLLADATEAEKAALAEALWPWLEARVEAKIQASQAHTSPPSGTSGRAGAQDPYEGLGLGRRGGGVTLAAPTGTASLTFSCTESFEAHIRAVVRQVLSQQEKEQGGGRYTAITQQLESALRRQAHDCQRATAAVEQRQQSQLASLEVRLREALVSLQQQKAGGGVGGEPKAVAAAAEVLRDRVGLLEHALRRLQDQQSSGGSESQLREAVDAALRRSERLEEDLRHWQRRMESRWDHAVRQQQAARPAPGGAGHRLQSPSSSSSNSLQSGRGKGLRLSAEEDPGASGSTYELQRPSIEVGDEDIRPPPQRRTTPTSLSPKTPGALTAAPTSPPEHTEEAPPGDRHLGAYAPPVPQELLNATTEHVRRLLVTHQQLVDTIVKQRCEAVEGRFAVQVAAASRPGDAALAAVHQLRQEAYEAARLFAAVPPSLHILHQTKENNILAHKHTRSRRPGVCFALGFDGMIGLSMPHSYDGMCPYFSSPSPLLFCILRTHFTSRLSHSYHTSIHPSSTHIALATSVRRSNSLSFARLSTPLPCSAPPPPGYCERPPSSSPDGAAGPSPGCPPALRPAAALSPSTALSSSRVPAPASGNSALLRLLNDPDEPYARPILEVDLPRITRVLLAGPSAAAVAAALRRPRVLKESSAPVFPAPNTSGGSAAEAVLEGLRVHGLEKQHQMMVEAEEKEKSQPPAHEPAPQEAAAAQQSAAVQHCWQGLCAVNCVLRVQIEDTTTENEDGGFGATKAELDAAFEAYQWVRSHYVKHKAAAAPAGEEERDFVIEEERWREDFVPELKELKEMFRFVKDPREIEADGGKGSPSTSSARFEAGDKPSVLLLHALDLLGRAVPVPPRLPTDHIGASGSLLSLSLGAGQR
eukprot:gene11185-7762_t